MSDPDQGQTARTIPIIQPATLQTSAPSPADPMEVSTMGPPARTGEENDTNGTHENMAMGDHTGSLLAGPNAAAAAATGGQQPKVVQTAFIHKLYK
jgi:hypothetical protein